MGKIPQFCYHCRLPLPKKPFTAKGLSYCCYGCFLTHEITGEEGEEGEALWLLMKLGLSTFFTMNIMILSYADYIYGFDESVSHILNYIMLLLSIPVIALLGLPFLINSLRSLSKLVLNMDTLIAIGTFSAYILSIISTVKSQKQVYFDTASMILVLVTAGRFLEANAKARASNAIKELLELTPKEARVIKDGVERLVPSELIRKGDMVKVLPGESFAVDGEVVEGNSSVDESMLSGESKPVFKTRGSKVFSGTINIDGVLIFRATGVGEESTLSRFIKLIEEARSLKSPVERLADKISSIFIPVVVSIAGITFAFWFFKEGINTAILNSLSVLLISCPCALGIAAPMAIQVALGRAAKEGILVRTGETFERLSHVRRVFLDKTGTLTKREMRLSSIFVVPNSNLNESDLISICASLESVSEHPLAKSTVEFASQRGYPLLQVSKLKVSPGMGIEGKVNHLGETVYIGSMRFMRKNGLDPDRTVTLEKERLESKGQTLVFCGWGKGIKGVLGFSEELREDAKEAILRLKELKIDTVILTGDNRYSAKAVAATLGIESKGELTPEDKVREIKKHKEVSVMVGDGINDVPALSAADIGIAIGCGTDIARESADINLLGESLEKIPWVIKLSRETRKRIKENLFWAFLYNTIGIVVAALGFLKPVAAALAMIVSSILVLGNSLRLQKERI